MKKLISKTHAKITKINSTIIHTKSLLCGNKAENYVDSGLKILIAVVIGALLLAGLYALFGDTILPTVKSKVEQLFDFNGN